MNEARRTVPTVTRIRSRDPEDEDTLTFIDSPTFTRVFRRDRRG
jgi:hypothetical protein